MSQIELDRMEPFPRWVEEDAHIRPFGGPNYFEMDSGEEYKPGQRIDVIPYVATVDRREGKEPKRMHGLKIMNVKPVEHMDSVFCYTLKRDEYSKPYPKKRRNELEDICSIYTRRVWQARYLSSTLRYFMEFHGSATRPSYLYRLGPSTTCNVIIKRGFPADLVVDFSTLSKHGETVTDFPIENVYLTRSPQWTIDFSDQPNRFKLRLRISDGEQTVEIDRYEGLGTGESLLYSLFCRRVCHAIWPKISLDNWHLPGEYDND